MSCFLGSSLGIFWMMFIAMRYESKPWRFIGLALIPFCFVWYYFERFRSGKHLTDSASGAAWDEASGRWPTYAITGSLAVLTWP